MKKWHLLLIAAVFVLLIGIIGGWNIRKATYHCPAITVDTIQITDTVVHTIVDHVPYYVYHTDTIIQPIEIPVLPTKEDTARILKDYFATHVYDRNWKNDTLEVYLNDTITQNKSIGNKFTYVIKTPFTTVNNSVTNITYNRYLTGGITIPLKDINSMTLDVRYNWTKGYIGGVYYPKSNAFGVSLGATLFKFKSVNTK